MLYLLLTILKFLGWFLVGIIAILILLLLLILLVPVRYKFQGEYGEIKKGTFQCSWLFHSLFFQANFESKEKKYLFKMLGFTLYPKKKKRIKTNKKKKKEKQQLEVIGHLTGQEENVKKEQEMDSKREIEWKEAQDKVEKITKEEKMQFKEEIAIKEERDLEEEEHPYFITRILRWIKKFFMGIKNIRKSFVGCIKKGKSKKEEIQKFLKNEKTQKAYRDCKYYTKNTILHIIPRKLKGEIQFGFEDPAKTGELLSILSLGLPIYKNNIRIIPYFDQVKLEGKLSGKGRISVGYCCYIFLRVWFHKEIRLTIKRAKKILK